MITFEKWFEEREPNGQMRCDNIYNELCAHFTNIEETYKLLEDMMRVAYCAGVTNANI